MTDQPLQLRPTRFEVREGAWAIVRNQKLLASSGHGHIVTWARAFLGLDDARTIAASQQSKEHPNG